MNRLKKYLSKVPESQQNSAAISLLAGLDHLEDRHPDIARGIIQELRDQRNHLKLIASENYCSLAVQIAMGNWLTDKYAEGFPFHRFYAGCENVDQIEHTAQEELKDLFGCDHAYVQPHSGASANVVAFFAILFQRVQKKELEKFAKRGVDQLTEEEHEELRQLLINQKLMAMSLNSGGHLTHGFRMNLSSKIMKSVHYEVDPTTEQLDYDQIEAQALQEKPTILLAGYSAYPRKIDFQRMRKIADKVGATFMVDMAHFSGLVAGKVFEEEFNPIPYADIVTSTTHKTLRGPRGGIILCREEYASMVDKGCPIAMGGPMPHIIAAKAIAFQEANTPTFGHYAKKVVENAQAMARGFQERGVRLVTGGTDNHLMVCDLSSFGLTGKQAEVALRAAHITVNRNTIPMDKNGPWYTSGIRLGTPALTTLGMGEKEMVQIAHWIADILEHTRPEPAPKTGGMSKSLFYTEPEVVFRVQGNIKSLLKNYPLYPELHID